MRTFPFEIIENIISFNEARFTLPEEIYQNILGYLNNDAEIERLIKIVVRSSRKNTLLQIRYRSLQHRYEERAERIAQLEEDVQTLTVDYNTIDQEYDELQRESDYNEARVRSLEEAYMIAQCRIRNQNRIIRTYVEAIGEIDMPSAVRRRLNFELNQVEESSPTSVDEVEVVEI